MVDTKTKVGKYVYLPLLFTFLAVLAVIFFWKYRLLLSVILFGVFCIKHLLIPIKIEYLWFLLSAIIGTTAESLAMRTGSWYYADPVIINFPLWLPFLWGLAGVLGVSLYLGLSKK